MTRKRFLGLRVRFVGAGVLLVLTTAAAAAWTLLVLSHLATVAETTVRDTDEATATSAAVSSALEREDDALLVILGGVTTGYASLSEARAVTDTALARMKQDSSSQEETRVASEVEASIIRYRQAVDSVIVAPGGQPLERYHREANPLLRRAVTEVGKARDERFEEARAATSVARDEVTRARNVVVLIAVFAVAIAAVVALRLARHVILPMRQLAQAARAVRDGNFETHAVMRPADEIGDVSEAFHDMTCRLAEFHRSNLGEVLRAKRTLEATIRALPDAVLLIDGTGRVAAKNPEADRLFEGLQLPASATADDVASALGAGATAFREALVRQGPFDQLTLESALRVKIRGDVHRFLPRIVPLAPEDGHSGVVLVLSDVTQLTRLDEMRAELVAVASHELRTPVTTLRMSLLMLCEMTEKMDARVRDLVSNALGGVDLLGETVDELLDMTRIEAGRLKLNVDTVDLIDLIREIASRNRARAEELGLRLEVHSAFGLPAIVGDRAQLRIVLDNIINNSLKYTPRGGSIEIRVAPRSNGEPSSVEVAVTDSGCGIPTEFRLRAFDKFFRVEHYRPGSEEAPHGSGIGLYLCKEIVELHGGNIRCETPEQGHGTQIVFDLPARGPVA
jgi:NtrC-family two-component system sensor histidine kinase KinB